MRRKKKEIIEWGCVKLRVVEQERCDACYWNTADGCKSPPDFEKYSGGCSYYERVDKRNVVFIEEKE